MKVKKKGRAETLEVPGKRGTRKRAQRSGGTRDSDPQRNITVGDTENILLRKKSRK